MSGYEKSTDYGGGEPSWIGFAVWVLVVFVGLPALIIWLG